MYVKNVKRRETSRRILMEETNSKISSRQKGHCVLHLAENRRKSNRQVYIQREHRHNSFVDSKLILVGSLKKYVFTISWDLAEITLKVYEMDFLKVTLVASSCVTAISQAVTVTQVLFNGEMLPLIRKNCKNAPIAYILAFCWKKI